MLRSRRLGRHHNEDTAELNITAFMNLMVILVPFLLITAVFSRLAILELNLPGSSSEPADPQEQTFQLEVIVRTDTLSTKLSELKNRYPQKTDAAILLEQDIAYDTLVQVMDRVRIEEEIDEIEESIVRSDLFPDISIGDAPVADGGA